MRESNPFPFVTAMFDSWGRPLAAMVVAWALSWWEGAPELLRGVVVGAFVLVCLDTLLGSVRALTKPDPEFTSARFGRVLVKLVVYMSSFLAAWAIDCSLGLNAAAQLAVVTLVVLREASSVMENSAALGFPWPEEIRRRLEDIERSLQNSDRNRDE